MRHDYDDPFDAFDDPELAAEQGLTSFFDDADERLDLAKGDGWTNADVGAHRHLDEDGQYRGREE